MQQKTLAKPDRASILRSMLHCNINKAPAKFSADTATLTPHLIGDTKYVDR